MTEIPLGEIVDWQPVAAPEPTTLAGAAVRLVPVDPAHHAEALFAASHDPETGGLKPATTPLGANNTSVWDYLFVGPFADVDEFREYLETLTRARDPLFFTVIDASNERPVGMVSFMRIVPEHGVIEIGGIWFSPYVQRSRLTTEAIYLLARHAFDDLGYRRLEWKCNALNAASRRAALRFGFVPEGVFRQALVVKGRNRDTAWFSITDGEWPLRRTAFERWLARENFDTAGTQRQTLVEIRTVLELEERAATSGPVAAPSLPENAALIVIDVQQGFEDPYWGRRNNVGAEANIARLQEAWRRTGRPIIHIRHMSIHPHSPLAAGSPGSEIKEMVRPLDGEPVLTKTVNSAFIGTDLEERLRSAGIDTVAIVGITTNHCAETTTRMAGNLGFDAFFVADGTATFDRVGPDGVLHLAEDIYAMTLSNLNDEFATIVTTEEILQRL